MKIVNLVFDSRGLYFVNKDNKILPPKIAINKIFVRFYNYFLDLKLFFLWLVGFIPSHILRNFFYRLSGIKIGKGSTLHMLARFYQPRNITIGFDTIIGSNAFLDGRDNLSIGSHVDIASNVMIYNSEHDLTSNTFKPICEPVIISDYCFVGPRSIIMPGVTIGKGAVVAAGAVVTKNVAPKTIVGGVPARLIGKRKIDKLDYCLGRARLFQ